MAAQQKGQVHCSSLQRHVTVGFLSIFCLHKDKTSVSFVYGIICEWLLDDELWFDLFFRSEKINRNTLWWLSELRSVGTCWWCKEKLLFHGADRNHTRQEDQDG